MEFGYFTLSDNHYENNPRNANEFVSNITAETLYAESSGMHSAWIGEHHFNSWACCPALTSCSRMLPQGPSASGSRPR